MSDNTTNTENTPVSLSKQRKIERKKTIAREKRNKKIGQIVWYVVLGLLAALACFCLFLIVRRIVTKVDSSSDYSKYITEAGLIEDVTATDYVELCDYKGISVAYSDIAYSDEDLDDDIDSLVTAKAAQSTTTDKAVESGDVIYVQYKGYLDNEVVDDLTTEDDGTQITVGSSSYNDYGFDDALIGKTIADDPFVVDITFPEDYTTVPDVAGKTVKFIVCIVSIKITPEFDDAFVAEYYAGIAAEDTAEAYRTYLRDQEERESLETYVSEYVTENSTATKYPSKYVKHMKSLLKYYAEQYYESYAQYYAYFGQSLTFEEFLGMSESKYDISLISSAKTSVKAVLVYQAIAEKEGITADIDSYKAYLAEEDPDNSDISDSVTTYGSNYLVQSYLDMEVIDFLADNAVVTGK